MLIKLFWMILYLSLAVTLIACFTLPDVVTAEPEGQWNSAPNWNSWLLFGSYRGENLVYTVTRAARITLSLGLIALSISVIVGIPLVFLHYYQKTRMVFCRFSAVMVYFPRLLFVVLLASLLALDKPSELSFPPEYYLVLLLSITGAVFFAAQSSTEVEKVTESLFVHFASSLRLSSWRIFWRHVLRNCTGLPVIVAKQLRDNVLFISIATFIGVVHLQPEDLGGLICRLYESPDAFFQGWWILFFPCASLCWLILLCDLVGEHLAQMIEREK